MKGEKSNFSGWLLRQTWLITHAHSGVSAGYDNKIQPIPRISQVRVFVDGETFGNNFYKHLDGVDCQEEELGLFDGLAHGKEYAIE